MITKRIGNDVRIRWELKRQDNTPESLNDALYIKAELRHSRDGKRYPQTHKLLGDDKNIIALDFIASEQMQIGEYDLYVTYAKADSGIQCGMATFTRDKCCVLRLVAKSCDLPTGEQDIDVVSIIEKGDKGDPFTFDDFTPEQIEDLMRPATDAGIYATEQGNYAKAQGIFANEKANLADQKATLAQQKADLVDSKVAGYDDKVGEVDSLILTVEQNEQTRQTQETTRQTNETGRASAESGRQTQESGRQSNETGRQSAETGRVSAENVRVSAEQGRASAETTRQTQETTRQNQESGRVSAENARISNEIGRQSSETARQTAEGVRNSNETTRQAQEQARQTNTGIAIQNIEDWLDTADATLASKQDKLDIDAVNGDNNKFLNELGDFEHINHAQLENKNAEEDFQHFTSAEKAETMIAVKSVLSDRFYGVERKRNVADPSFEEIGDPLMAQRLPLHKLVRICKVNEDRQVVNYLDQSDPTKNEDGTPSILDGSDDLDVMVHYPDCYAIIDGGGDENEVWAISDVQFEYNGEQARHIESFFMSADYCTSKDGKSRCVQSEDPAFAGTGSNFTAGGIGYPLTQLSRYSYETRAIAKGEKWNNWLWVDELVLQAYMYIEYKTRYLRSSEIFGNIGAGWTSEDWNNYNGYRPVIKILEAHLGLAGTPEVVQKGHLTGVFIKEFNFEIGGVAKTYSTPFGVYRGRILWGHLWKHFSGVDVEIQSKDAGGQSNVYVQYDPDKVDANRSDSNFSFMDTYELTGQAPRNEGWARETIPHAGSARLTGGSVSTYSTAYWWTSAPATGRARRCFLVGAPLHSSNCAPSSVHSYTAPSTPTTNIGGGFRAEAR